MSQYRGWRQPQRIFRALGRAAVTGWHNARPRCLPLDPVAQNDRRLSVGEVLRAELETLFPDRWLPRATRHDGTEAEALANQVREEVDHLSTPLAALCLSGGGIRSAAFALGAIQGLARFGLLGRFHYLSTVSGGGYIGSWLTAWRHYAGSDRRVFAALNQRQPSGREPPEITGIRADSNYLTPKLGMLSADTWAALALVVRNLVLNWLVFGPFFLGVLFVPRVFARVIANTGGDWFLAPWFVGAGAVLACFGLGVSVYGRSRIAGNWLTNPRFGFLALAPIMIAAGCFTVAAATGAPARCWSGWAALVVAGLAGGAGYALAAGAATLVDRRNGNPAARSLAPLRGRDRVRDFICWTIGGAVAGLLLLLGLRLAAGLADSEELCVSGIAGAIGCGLVGELLYVGLSSASPRGDMDREWLARSAGWLAAVATTWVVVAGVDFYGPCVLHWAWHQTTKWFLGIGGLSGVAALALGASGRTAATTAKEAVTGVALTRLASVAGLVFAVFLAAGLSLVDEHWLDRGTLLAEGAGAVALPLLALAISRFVNINRFSLHAVYRNRLMRAFLGAARAGATSRRKPDPFTGFDQTDNLPMASLQGSHRQNRRLLHVVNMTLNVVSPPNLAWQERKAETFTATRLACGNPDTGYRETARFGGPDGGLSLGTAMAISGAAISPNWGYHSSPLVGVLLMLFNVRLGWWLGNPRCSDYERDGPRYGLSPALRELAGMTRDDTPWIYLSDGGHFENLGLYEMVRRRYRLIVVCDAGTDPKCSFEDLGNAVRKIFIDQGVGITFRTLALKARQDPPVPGVYCAVGTITYPRSTRPGWLLYIKPGYHGTEPADIRAYAAAHPTFPHESIADQWFSESQFEAYRGLGAHILERICNGGRDVPAGSTPRPIGLAKLRRRAQYYLRTAR